MMKISLTVIRKIVKSINGNFLSSILNFKNISNYLRFFI